MRNLSSHTCRLYMTCSLTSPAWNSHCETTYVQHSYSSCLSCCIFNAGCFCDHRWRVNAKLHYTDSGYGHVVQHHQRTSSQQFYNLLYNKFTTNGEKFATSQHLDMSRCWALALPCGKRWRCCTTCP